MNKPRPPSLNPAIFDKRIDTIEVAKNRLDILDEHRKKDKLPATYIALEALSFIQAAREQGYTDDQLRGAWCDSWGKQEVIVPAALLNTLMTAWLSYQVAPPGKTLGEAFWLEGGGQGKASKHKLQMTRDKHRYIAHQVETVYITAQLDGKPISEEKAQEIITERLGWSFEAVHKAHRKYKPEIRAGLQRLNDEVD